MNPTLHVAKAYSPEEKIILYPGDVNDFLETVPDHSIKLIVTSPPYNVGKEYEVRVSIEKYLEQQELTVKHMYDKLSPDGSICWQVGNYIEKGEVYPLDIFYYRIFKEHLGMQLRNRIVWHFGHGLHASKRFSGRYETLHWFTKSDQYIFNLDAVRIPQLYPGKTHFKQGEKYGKPSGNPQGKNPSDVWEIMAREFEDGMWNVPNCKANHPEKTEHPAQFPIEIAERCVLAFTNEGDVVFDPYAGVGSALIAAIKNNRVAMGSEREPAYVKTAKERIKLLQQGKLPMRKIGTPVHQPSGKEKVAQIPLEWKLNNDNGS
jgi:adenine-specific DNA-methyltransferase